MSGLDTSQAVTDAASLGAEQVANRDNEVSSPAPEDTKSDLEKSADNASEDQPEDLDDFLGDATPDRGSG